jgi:glutaconate CoA-transferase subunit A
VSDKRTTVDDIVGELRSGMTIGIGGWGSRRKPMALVRALCRSELTDLTIVAYGGPDVGLLCATGKVRKVVCGFVTLDSIALDPHWRVARQHGRVEVMEVDEGMFFQGLQAAAWRVPFLPTRAGLGSDVLRINPDLKLVRSPYGADSPHLGDPADADVELVAMPALRLDAALVHTNRADTAGNGQILSPDAFFDPLFLGAAERRFLTTEKVVANGALTEEGPLSTVVIHRMMTDGVAETPGGAHFTANPPDYGRDEAFQKEYAASAADPAEWDAFSARYIEVPEDEYQARVNERQHDGDRGAS